MVRIAQLKKEIGPPEHFEACLLCMKMHWLGGRGREFHRRIAKEEKHLKTIWIEQNKVMVEDFEDIAKRLELWKKAVSRVNVFLSERQAKLEKEYPVKKTKRVKQYLKNYKQLTIKSDKKTKELRSAFFEYNALIKKEKTKYIKDNTRITSHVYWDNKVNGYMLKLQKSHPICTNSDKVNICGIRIGEFHSAQTLTFLAYEGFYFGDSRCQYCRQESVRIRQWFVKRGA